MLASLALFISYLYLHFLKSSLRSPQQLFWPFFTDCTGHATSEMGLRSLLSLQVRIPLNLVWCGAYTEKYVTNWVLISFQVADQRKYAWCRCVKNALDLEIRLLLHSKIDSSKSGISGVRNSFVAKKEPNFPWQMRHKCVLMTNDFFRNMTIYYDKPFLAFSDRILLPKIWQISLHNLLENAQKIPQFN